MRFDYETPSLVQIGLFAMDTGFIMVRPQADPITGLKGAQ